MTDAATQTEPERFFASLPEHEVLEITGADVVPFLQTKLTCDTRTWAETGGGYGFALDIRGRVVGGGWFAIDPQSDSPRVIAVVPASSSEPLVAHLDKYVIVEDVVFTARDDDRVWLCDASTWSELAGTAWDSAPASVRPVELDGVAGVATTWPRAGRPAGMVIADEASTPALQAAFADAGATEIGSTDVERWQIAAGVPAIGREIIVDEHMPIEAGAWDGISLTKGCYLGQEVIERLFARGRPARRLIRVTGAGSPPDAGAEVQGDSGSVGTIASSTPSDAGWVGMAWIKRKAFDDAPWSLDDGRPVERVGFVGGPTPPGASWDEV